MAKILEYRELLLADLLVDKGQVRTQNVDKEIDQLAESIRSQGLLQSIVVCAAAQGGAVRAGRFGAAGGEGFGAGSGAAGEGHGGDAEGAAGAVVEGGEGQPQDVG